MRGRSRRAGEAGEGAQVLAVAGGGGAEVDDLGGTGAVDQAGGASAGEAGLGAGARALAAVEAAAALASAGAGHGGLTAGAVGAGLGAAAVGGEGRDEMQRVPPGGFVVAAACGLAVERDKARGLRPALRDPASKQAENSAGSMRFMITRSQSSQGMP